MPFPAQTEVEVADLALAHARLPAVGDLASKSAPARVARKWFGQARDETLAAAWWSFAKAWVQPAMDVVPSPGPLKNRFPLPPDCLAIRYVEDTSREDWDTEAATVTIAGAAVDAIVLVTNVTAPLVCYTRRVADPALWPPAFVTAFSLKLGAYVANELARSAGLANDLLTKFAGALPAAERQDGRQRRAEQISRDTPWVRARRGHR